MEKPPRRRLLQQPGTVSWCCAAVAVLTLLAGCAEAEPGVAPAPAESSRTLVPSTGTSLPVPTSATSTAGRTIEVSVTGREVSPPPAQVDLAVGETLSLVVTTDTDTTLHAHGFEIETPVQAGQPTSVSLTGTAPGLYEVELHDPDLLLLQVAVR